MDRFCELHEDRPKMIGANEPPAPDFTLAIGSQQILIELARYREQGPYNEAVERDNEFKERYLNMWLYDPDVNQYDMELVYRTRHAGAPEIPGVRKDQREADDAIRQLKYLVKSLRPLACRSRITVCLVPRVEIKKFARRNSENRYVGLEGYSTLAKYVERVHVRRTGGARVGLPQTSIQGGHYAPDYAEIERVLRAKHGRLPEYRAAAGDRQVWLLLYEEGGITGRIPRPTLEEVLQFNRDQVRKFSDRFDAAWWGHRFLGCDPTLHRIG